MFKTCLIYFPYIIARFGIKNTNVCQFDYIKVVGSGKVGTRKPVNNASLATFVFSTNRPKSARSRCVNKTFYNAINVNLC